MGRRIRQIVEHVVYETAQGVVDRQFMFKPDHRADNPLLSVTSPPDALDPSNDLTPVPSTINIIGAAIGRAIRDVPVRLYCFETNLTHKHCEESVDDSCCLGAECEYHGTARCGGVESHPARFHQRVNSVIAQQINKKYERNGHLWAEPDRVTPCTNDETAEENLFYALTNPVKDGLLSQTSGSPFFSTFDFWSKGKKLRFWYIDWEAYDLAGGKRKKSHKPKDYLHWVEWEPEPLPNWANKPRHKYVTFIRKNVRAVEEQARELRRQEGRPAMSREKLFALDPRDRPKSPRIQTRQPLCHASSAAERKEFERNWREFLKEHRAASLDYLMGDYTREFPKGSFRPPLITTYTSSPCVST